MGGGMPGGMGGMMGMLAQVLGAQDPEIGELLKKPKVSCLKDVTFFFGVLCFFAL